MKLDQGGHRPNAVVFGCLGTTLSDDERRFYQDCNPFGFILFARNCETPDQIYALVSDMRSAIGRDDAPVLIDQEGGRVQRLKPPLWPSYLSARALVDAALKIDPSHVSEAVYLNARLIAHDLMAVGVDVNCTPVLDVPVAGGHDVVGDRAYGDEPGRIADMGGQVCDGMFAGGVMPVIKHIPGHGRAMADSHKELPVVTAAHSELSAVDFKPFQDLSDMPWGMTCHLMFPDLDPDNPATQSSIIINDVIRGEIGFDGVLCTDDLSMKALGGTYREKAEKSLSAGCDLVVHCNGDMSEMTAVADGVGTISDKATTRLERGEVMRRERRNISDFDVEVARTHLNSLTGNEPE
jgi:beta-N-acetylhexosaminidase